MRDYIRTPEPGQAKTWVLQGQNREFSAQQAFLGWRVQVTFMQRDSDDGIFDGTCYSNTLLNMALKRLTDSNSSELISLFPFLFI